MCVRVCGVMCVCVCVCMLVHVFTHLHSCVSTADWSSCSASCGAGTQFRTKNVVVQPHNGARECPSPNSAERYESRDCEVAKCPVNCEVSAWSPFTACSVTCGVGVQQATRTVVTAAAYGGRECPALTTERSCDTNVTCTDPVSCQVRSILWVCACVRARAFV